MGEELNIGEDHDGDPTEEVSITGEKPWELAATLDDACECDESEPAIEE